MADALEVYRHAADKIQDWTMFRYTGTSTTANLQNYKPGSMCIWTDGFIIRGLYTAGDANNHLWMERKDWVGYNPHKFVLTTTKAASAAGTTNCYSGSQLATHITNIVGAYVDFTGYNFVCSYDTTTHKFTMSADGAFDMDFTADAPAQRLGDLLGFGPTLQTGASTYTSTTATYCDDAMFVAVMQTDSHNLTPIKTVMVYDTNLSSSAPDYLRVQGIGLTDWDGPDWQEYVGVAHFDSGWVTATGSGINDIYVFDAAGSRTGDGIECIVWLLSLRRTATPSSGDTAKVGVFCAWEEPQQQPNRNYAAPYVVTPVLPDSVTYPEMGGASYRLQRRAYYEATLPFRRFGTTVYNSFETMLGRFGRFEGLWRLAPDDDDAAHTLWCIPDLQVTERAGPERVVSFDVNLRQIPMHPRD